MRVAVVTGASSGIGAALCRALRADGWHVVGLSRSDAPDADEHEPCDVGDREAVEAAAARVLERHPRIDLLVNNAGIAGRYTYLTAPPEAVEAVIRTNYLGSVWCLRAFLPGLGEGSHLVNVVSIAGLFAVGPYSASKHAQLAFSRSVAVELAARGISVHTVNPGLSRRPASRSTTASSTGYSGSSRRPELVAARILDAVEHDRREIIVPRWYRPVAWAQALTPGSSRAPRACVTWRRVGELPALAVEHALDRREQVARDEPRLRHDEPGGEAVGHCARGGAEPRLHPLREKRADHAGEHVARAGGRQRRRAEPGDEHALAWRGDQRVGALQQHRRAEPGRGAPDSLEPVRLDLLGLGAEQPGELARVRRHHGGRGPRERLELPEGVGVEDDRDG